MFKVAIPNLVLRFRMSKVPLWVKGYGGIESTPKVLKVLMGGMAAAGRGDGILGGLLLNGI